MRPSSPAGVGRIGDTLVFLLPGNPVSCLCAYDFFAGRAIRLRGGRPADWPHRTRQCAVARKIVSAIGRVDYCRVRIVDDRVEPIALSGASILSSTTRADGFVIVPARKRRLRSRHRGHRLSVRLIERATANVQPTAGKSAAAEFRPDPVSQRRHARRGDGAIPRASSACAARQGDRAAACRRCDRVLAEDVAGGRGRSGLRSLQCRRLRGAGRATRSARWRKRRAR